METENKKAELESLVEAISPCDTSKPFYYVSYAIADADKVYKDVVALQKDGYNIWIDIPANFNTGHGFNSTIFRAISNEYCKGILFYVSDTSMTSTQNVKEVAYARASWTEDAHPGGLPVYVVEAVDVANSDYDHWLQNQLTQAYEDADLNVAERANINDYREKYNSKIGPAETKLDVATTMRDEMKQSQRGIVAYEADNEARAKKIKALLG